MPKYLLEKSILLLCLFLMCLVPFRARGQTTLVQESFETDGEGSRYTSNSGNTAPTGNDIWERTNLNPAPFHANPIVAGSRDGSWYWAGEAVSDLALNGGADGNMTLNALNVSGFSSLDVQIALGMSRFGETRWERNDVVRVEYNMDGSGWNIIGLFRGNNPTDDFSGGELAQETDNNEATYGPYGTLVNGTFADFTLPIPVTGNSLQVRVTGAFLGSEEVGFDNIRIRGVASSNDPPVLASIEIPDLAYSEGDPATQITNTVTVSDNDDINIESATVQVTTNFDASEDVLAFTPSGGITGSYNPATGILSLSGTSSLANYQTVLRSVTYENTDAIDASAATRTIAFQVNDGTDNSNIVTRDIDITTSLNTTPVALPFCESFETDGEGARYGSNHFSSGCTFAERGPAGTNVGGCFAEILTGADGGFVWNTESTNANGGFVLTSQAFDISSFGTASITMEILLAVSRDDETRWESTDQVRIEYSIDGGAYVIAGLFTGTNPNPILGSDLFEDLDQDPGTLGPFAATPVPDVFTNYSFNFTGSGSTITYRVVVNSTGTEELAFDNVCLSAAAAAAGATPCNSATRYEEGSHWRTDGTINDAPNAPEEQGIVACGQAANTQSQIMPFPGFVYDPTSFLVDVSGLDCVDPSTGNIVTPLNPTNGEPIIILNFDVRANGGSFQTQINDNSGDNVAWALYSSDVPTNSVALGASGDSISGDCSQLTLRACGVESSNTWNTLPVPNFSQTTNYYLVIWDQDADGDLQINNFKTRNGCGDADVLVCNIEEESTSTTCNNDGTYSVSVNVNGINGEYVAYDANATPPLSSAICLTNPGENSPVTSGVLTLTYPQGTDYNITIFETTNSNPPTPVTPDPGCDHPDDILGGADNCVLNTAGTAPVCFLCPTLNFTTSSGGGCEDPFGNTTFIATTDVADIDLEFWYFPTSGGFPTDPYNPTSGGTQLGTAITPTGTPLTATSIPASNLPYGSWYIVVLLDVDDPDLTDPTCRPFDGNPNSFLLEQLPDAGDDVDTTVCQGVIIDLTGVVTASVGSTSFFDPGNTGGLVGSNFNTSIVGPGVYQIIHTAETGISCPEDDATITITVDPSDTTNVAATTCDPGLVGVTQMVLTNQFGCDSTVITTTTLLPSDTTNVAATSCDPGQVGVTQQIFTNQFGCDSTVITTTTLLPSDTTNVAATSCDPGQVGVTQMVLTNQFGCDSTVITTTTLLPSDTTNVAATSCDPGQVGVTQMVLTNQFGCDSTVITTTTLLPSDTTNIAEQTCDPAEVGVVQQSLTNQFGCDSVVITTTTLAPIPVITFADIDTLCLNDGVVALGGATPTGGVYSGPGVTDNGNGSTFTFDPSVSGVGMSNVTYTYTDMPGWNILGDSIKGLAAGDGLGRIVDISRDGNRFITGAPSADPNGSSSGQAFVFEWNGSTWVQIGQFDGNRAFEFFGTGVAITPDGNRIAIGSGTSSIPRRVDVYDWNGVTWVQVGASLSEGGAAGAFGNSIDFSEDGSRIAVGADGTGADKVFVYDFDGVNWNQVGNTLAGDRSGDRFGDAVKLSGDGSILIVGANENNFGLTSPKSGYARVFELIGSTWTPLGQKLTGVADNDNYGNFVDINTAGTRIGISNTGQQVVQIFDYDSGSNMWVQAGADVPGGFPGYVSMDDSGNKVAVPAATFATRAKIFEWNGSAWVEDPTVLFTEFSASRPTISGNGNRIVFGNSQSNNYVQVFENALGCSASAIAKITVNPNDTTNVAATTCDPGDVGVAQMVLTNQFGCDSLIITTTTLLPSDTTNVAATTCDPGMVGVTDMILTNQFGCDSVIITTTTLLPSDTTNVAATTCDPSMVGVADMTFTNQFGCDSIVITTTTLLPSDTTNVAATTCNPGDVGVSQMVLTNQLGCDSVIITTTTLLPSDTTHVAATTCDPGDVGVSQMVLTNQFGCDSVIITTTTLLPSDTTHVAATTCDPAEEGVSQETLTNQFGCDSLVITTTTLLIDEIVCEPTNHSDDNNLPSVLNHAFWLENFPAAPGMQQNDRFIWVPNTAEWKQFPDGTATLTGQVVNIFDPNVIFDVDILLVNQMDWATWSGLGRLYKNDNFLNPIGNAFVNWQFFEFDASSTMTGAPGSTYDGDVITMTHRPADMTYGPQLGFGANDIDDSYGFATWFSWSGTLAGQTYTHENGDINIDLDCEPSPCADDYVSINAKVFLEGPYDPATGLMRDDLKLVIPFDEPYTDLGFNQIGAGGGESIVNAILNINGGDAMVDWVLVELRDATDPTQIIATRTGILQRDGDIADVDGFSSLVFEGVSPGDYYVAVRHRNHLGIMTADTRPLSETPIDVNFTDGSVLTYGTNAQNEIGTTGVKAMVCADVNGDGVVDALDRGSLWNSRSTNGYLNTDANCDGVTDALDRGAGWNNRSRQEQLPN